MVCLIDKKLSVAKPFATKISKTFTLIALIAKLFLTPIFAGDVELGAVDLEDKCTTNTEQSSQGHKPKYGEAGGMVATTLAMLTASGALIKWYLDSSESNDEEEEQNKTTWRPHRAVQGFLIGTALLALPCSALFGGIELLLRRSYNQPDSRQIPFLKACENGLLGTCKCLCMCLG